MAKISKKPTPLFTSFEPGDFAGLLDEETDDAGGVTRGVPLVHIPNVDMFSSSGKLIIECEMPGVRKEDIEISLAGCTLIVKAMKFECFEDNRVNYVCMERAFGKVYREINVPFTVDTTKIKAAYRNGILTITAARIKDKRSTSMRIPIETEDCE